MTPEEAFGRALQDLRQRRGVSQEQLGFASGYHRNYISLLERGKKSPSLTALLQLARALNVRPTEFIQRVEADADLNQVWHRRPGGPSPFAGAEPN